MRARVRFLPEARADLHEIWDYIAEDNIEAAARFVDLVEGKCTLLARSPDIGRARDELAPCLADLSPARAIEPPERHATGVEDIRVRLVDEKRVIVHCGFAQGGATFQPQYPWLPLPSSVAPAGICTQTGAGA